MSIQCRFSRTLFTSTMLFCLLSSGSTSQSFAEESVVVPLKSPTTNTATITPKLPGGFEPNIFVSLAKKIVPSVVNISTYTTVKSALVEGDSNEILRRFFGDLFRQYPGGPGMPGGPGGDDEDDGPGTGIPTPNRRAPKAMALGTGFIIDDGLILTNNHVVSSADEIKISFTEEADEKPSDAEVVGRDQEMDIALIKVKNKRKMVAAVLGDSDALEVGEYVMAVGNPVGHGHSVTHGIISAKGRPAPDFPLASYLQTDAPINPGNSGGPLVSLKGEVVGINNAIDQRAHGIGFAIPINLVKKILPQLRTSGVVARGYIGVLVDKLNPEVAKRTGQKKNLSGPFVTHVYPGEPADKAGVKPYDVILEFNNVPVKSGNDLIAAVTGVGVGEKTTIKISRAGEEKTLKIEVGRRPGTPTFASKDKDNSKSKKNSNVKTGMTIENLTSETARELKLPEKTRGVLVTSIDYGGPADKAGLIRGDLILEVDRKEVSNVDEFFNLVRDNKSYLLRVRCNEPQGREAFSVIVLDLKR